MKHLALIERQALALDAGFERAVMPRTRTYGDARSVVRQLDPDNPLFLFAAGALSSRVRAFLEGFPGETAYAVKANPGAHVLQGMVAAGIRTFDVASLDEIERVRAVLPGAVIHYHNPVKSRAEIRTAAIEHGVRRFVADCPEEIEKIASCLANHVAAGEIELAIRFRLPASGRAVHDFTSKFGATAAETSQLLVDVVARGYVPVLTFHPGSQCTEPAAWRRHIIAASEIARTARVELARLNVGGGFPDHYAGLEAPDLATIFNEIADATRTAFGARHAPHLECEPGRGLVASSSSLLARVKLVKQASGEVYLNDGIYGGLLEWSQAPSLRPAIQVIRAGRKLAGTTFAAVLYGPTCDPLDRLPATVALPRTIREGDHIELGPLGAYGAATSTRFNGYGAAAVVPVLRVLGA